MAKKKFPLRQVLAGLLILGGVGIALFPQAKAWYMNRQEKEIIQEFREIMMEDPRQMDQPSKAVDPTPTPAPTPQPEQPVVENIEDFEDQIVEWESDEARREYLRQHMEGILTIPKIQLEMPVLRNATDFNLKVGLASLDYAAEMGQVGNYCVAGHRARARGRQFNRLNELEVGDIIQATSKTGFYTYEVFDKILVKADEVWVTKPHEKYEKIVTLITCDYRLKPTGRLIVFGKLISEK